MQSRPYQTGQFLLDSLGEATQTPVGSKKVRLNWLNQEDWDGLLPGSRPGEGECPCSDVNVDYVGRMARKIARFCVKRLATNVNLRGCLIPPMAERMEAGLKVAGGKCILNSTNYKDGNDASSRYWSWRSATGCGGGGND